MRQLAKMACTAAGIGLAVGSFSTATPAYAADEEKISLLAYLGLTAAEGKTVADAEAGKAEINQLIAPLIAMAATTVWADVATKAPDKNVLPAVGESKIDLRPLYFAKTRLDAIEHALGSITPESCAKSKPKPKSAIASTGGAEGATPDTSAGGLLKTGFELLKSDTTLTGIETDVSDDLLLNALAKAATVKSRTTLLFAQDIQALGPITPKSLWSRYTRQMQKADLLASKGCDKHETHGATYAFGKGQLTEIATSEKDAPSLLEQAMLLESLESKQPLILKLNLEAANGTMINVHNVWTTLGAEALRFRAGISLSYRLTDPVTGEVTAAGTVRCALKPVGFRNINSAANKAGASDCK